MSGVMSVTGFSEMPPVKAGPALCDFGGGVHLFGAIAAALFQRERTGQGCYIDVSMLEAVYPTLASNIGSLHSERDDLPVRTGNRHGGLSLCPYSVYRTTDGFVAIICNNDKHWAALLRAMGRGDLLSHPYLSTMRGRVEHMEEVDAVVEAWTSLGDRDSVYASLTRHAVPSAPVRELREVMADRHMHERGMLFEVNHPEYGPITVCRSPLNFGGSVQPPYRTSPEYGADTTRILGEIGVEAEEIDALRRAAVI
jgi:formyl-CoA transferase